MIKNKKQMFLVISVFALILFLGGTTYAWFSYRSETSEQELVAGEIYLHLNEGQEEIELTNIFPETATEARARDDNYMTFEITGKNTSNKTIYYEFILDHGIDKESPKTRYRDGDLRFDLVELDNNGDEVRYLLNNVNYGTLVNKRIWVDTVDSSTTTEIERHYKLRMWLDENVIISDTDLNATYNTIDYSNKYATIKLTVIGDFQKKSIGAFYDIKKNADVTTLINFAEHSSSRNGEGLYVLKGTEYDQYPIYYYRGGIDNNNVLFGGFCWQIVRTTETGGIKMIYNGFPDISGSGENISYNCGTTRDIQDTIMTTESLQDSTGYYYADDYEIVRANGNVVRYRLKAGTNGIHQVAIANSTAAANEISTIAENYPYTCRYREETDTCTTLYKVDSYSSGTDANVYSSIDRSIIGYSKYNSNGNSASDVGYMSNARYAYKSMSSSGSIFGRDIEWHTDHYLVIDETTNTASTKTEQTNYYHYTCGTNTNGVGDTECAKVRYYYSNNSYIELENGELLEDALYKMTGNGSDAVKERNSGYILNQNDSAIKVTIDNWFRTNLTSEVNQSNLDYSTYLEDTVFCNDRSFKLTGNYYTYTLSGWNPQGGNIGDDLMFGVHNRFQNDWYSTTNVPSMTCPNETDRFTVLNDNGNGALTYPVGLLTADEAILGGSGGNNTSSEMDASYLPINNNYWTLSPSRFYYYSKARLLYVSKNGAFDQGATDIIIYGVRPVVSLKLGTEFETGGDGTGLNPYIVKYN